MTRRDECPVRWCHEAGDHAEHRRYLISLPVWRGAWVIGVNVTQPIGREARAEMTIMPRRDPGVTMLLVSGEARVIGDALRAASNDLPK